MIMINRLIWTIVLLSLIVGCNKPSPDVPGSRETKSEESARNYQTITFRASSPPKVVKLTAVPVDSENIDAFSGIKARLSFKEKVVTVNPKDLLKDVDMIKRLKPTYWSDLPSYSTDYLIKYSTIKPQNRVEPSPTQSTSLNFEKRWWAVFDFNGDNMADWVGIQIINKWQFNMDLVCVCSKLDQEESIVLHRLIPVAVERERAAFVLGRESVPSSRERMQQSVVEANEKEGLMEGFSQIIYWNGKQPQSISRSDLHDDNQKKTINITCEKCIYYYIDYSQFYCCKFYDFLFFWRN